MTNPTSIGDLVLSPALDESRFWADFARLQQQVEREGVKLHVDDRAALSATDRVKKDLEALGSLTGKQANEQARAAKVLGAQYQASAKALQEQNAAVVAGYRSQTAASRAEVAAAQERAARIREQQAQMRLTSQLAAQARREEEQRYAASINALNNEQRAYRNLWQSRQLSDDQVIEAQRRIHAQALLQAQAVDKQSDAYRRLTQVAAAAQRTMDSAQGINTPGGFGAGVTQGILQALGNLGPFGQLLEQIISSGMQAAEQAAQEGARDVARNAGEGLKSGLAAEAVKVRQAAVNLADQVQGGAEDALDIHSPSRVMRRVGAFAGDGLRDGLLSKRAEVAAAAKTLANTVEQNATPTLALVSGGGMGGAALPGVAVLPSAQANLRGVAMQAALTTAALGGTALAAGAVSVALVNGTQKAAAYQQGLAEISTLTNKMPADLDELGRRMLKLSVETRKSFADLKLGYEEILGASVKGTDSEPVALKFLERSAQLAKVTREETRTAANALTSILNAYELDAGQASKVTDMLWASISAGKVRLGEIAGSLGAVAGQAKSLGVPLEELLGAMALLTTRGIPASTALEYIRSALTNVQKPSKEARDLARSLGIEFSATSLKSLGLVKFLDQLGRGVGDNSEALATLIGDVGGLQAVIGLLNGGLDDTDGILSKVTDSTGELDRATAKLKGTAQDNVGEFNAAWERTQILFNGSLLSGFTGLLEKGVNPLLIKLGDLKEAMNNVDTPAEMHATLQITAKDDGTTAILKFLLGAGQEVEKALDPKNNPALRAAAFIVARTGLAGGAGEGATNDADLVLRRIQPQVGEGPLLPGQQRAVQQATDGIVQALGLAGKTILNEFGVSGKDYHHDGAVRADATHNGIDFGAARGTPILAPFAGQISTRQDAKNGKVFELVDALGNKLVGIHLDQFDAGVQEALRKGGGKALILRGQQIGTVGNTGTTAGSAPHLHLMGYRAGSSTPVDARTIGYAGLTGSVRPAPALNTSGTAAGFAAKPFESYVKEAQRLTDAVAKYAPGGAAPNADRWRAATAQLDKFRDSNDLAAQAVQWVGLETGKSKTAVSEYDQTFDKLKGQLDITASLDNLGRPAADITSRLDTIRQQALAGAEAEKKRWGETAKYKALLDLAGDAAKKLEQVRGRKADLTPLQREQQQQQDAVAQQRMEASLRKASGQRLQQLVDGGVTPEVSLAKWQAAQAEIKRRQDAQDKDDRKREEDRKVAGQNRLAAERALADGQFELADRAAGLVLKTYDRQVKGAGGSAAARLDIEERLGADVLAARETQARVAAQQEKTRLERERNTAVNATGLTLTQRQKLWNQYGDKIRQVDADLAETLVGIQDDATRQLADLQQKAFSEENVGKAEAYADRLRATIASLPGRDEEGLITVYGEARAARDQDLLKAVYEEWERRRLDEEEAQRVIFEMQAQANTALAEGARKVADELAAAGDSAGALATLETALDGVMDAAGRGEDAADAINLLTDAINTLTGNATLTDEFNTFVAGLSGTIDEQISQVLARLEEVTDPAMRARLQGLLKDLRADLPRFVDPYTAGYVPGTNGFVNSGDAPDLEEVAKARDLGTLLDETTDPTQVQALMGEVVDLLASEIGQRLPDTIRTGLEESVKGAQGYLDALAQITEDGIVDGWERAGKVALQNPTPENRFSDFSTRIFSMGAAGLSDPTQYDALTSSLQQARAASQLTEADLQNLLALIEELRNPKTPEVGTAFDFGQWQADIQTLTDDFDAGRMTAGEYSSGLRDAAVQLNELADEAERMGNLKLAGQFRELAGSLRAMSPEIAGLLKGLGKVQEYAGYVQDLAGAFSTLAEGVGNDDLAANLNGLGNLAGKVAALAGDVMRIIANPADIGAWVGAITKIVSAIGEALNGHRKAYEQAAKMREDFNKRFTLLNGDDFAKTTVRSRGWLADTFGGGPEVKQVVDEFGLKIAQAIEGGVMGGIKNGMKQALTTGDWTNFRNTFRESAYSGVVDGLIEAIFNDALKDILAPGIKALTDAAKTPGTEDDAAAVAAFEAGIVAAEQFLTTTGQAIQPSLDRLRNNLGVTTPGSTGGVDITGLSTLPEPIQFALATPLLDGVRVLKDAADILKEGAVIIRDTFKDGVKVTVQQGSNSYTSTTGALV